MQFPSRLIQDAVEAFASLPGIGRKTALRLTLHLMQQEKQTVRSFGERVMKMRDDILFCQTCHNVSDRELCDVCGNPAREQGTICVVESIRDLFAIENTGQYSGVYHVLGGIISPVDGIGPEQLKIESLLNRVTTRNGEGTELIMALSPTMEGDTTVFYLTRRLGNADVTVSTIARGVAFGGDLEYADEITLARSIATRRPYQK